MTTVAERDIALPWEHFLGISWNDQELPEGARRDSQRFIDVFRANEWKAIRRDLEHTFNWVIPEDREPHWVGPGRAVYWQEQIVRTMGPYGPDPRHEGRRIRVWTEVSKGWAPTSSYGLPANNPSIIAHYLNKGFRLRPPVEGVPQEVLRNAAVPAEALLDQPPPEEEHLFMCERHGQEITGFKTWRGYVKHCVQESEQPEVAQMPPGLLDRVKQYKWYCALHDKGYIREKLAKRHVRTELRRISQLPHPTILEMEVK